MICRFTKKFPKICNSHFKKSSYSYLFATNYHRFRLDEVILLLYFLSPQGISNDNLPPSIPTWVCAGPLRSILNVAPSSWAWSWLTYSNDSKTSSWLVSLPFRYLCITGLYHSKNFASSNVSFSTLVWMRRLGMFEWWGDMRIPGSVAHDEKRYRCGLDFLSSVSIRCSLL